MVNCALLISLVIAGQLTGAGGRYSGSGSNQPDSGLITPIGDADTPPDPGAGSPRSAFDTSSAAAAGGSNTSSPGNSSTPAGGAKNPLRGSPSANQGAPQSMPLIGNDSQPIRGPNNSQSTPAAYEVSPGAPTSFGAPPAADTGRKPSALMRAMLNPPPGSQLRGMPVSLRDVLAGARSRSEQTQRVDAYWDMCSSVADYYLGLLEVDEFGRLRQIVRQVGPEWDQAERELRVRNGTSQRAALASQLRLANMIGRGPGNLPLPADMPHCASYTTHFEQIFAGGGSPEAKELAALLPLRYEELRDAGSAVTRAEQFSEQVARNGDATGTLRALEFLALRRRAFVQIARDYNRRIARYSELASPGQVSPERLTGMLILSPASATATKAGATMPPVNQRSGNGATPPSTYIEGSAPAMTANSTAARRDDAVQQASGKQPATNKKPAARVERSLLVPAH
jgi:hypothetical protein